MTQTKVCHLVNSLLIDLNQFQNTNYYCNSFDSGLNRSDSVLNCTDSFAQNMAISNATKAILDSGVDPVVINKVRAKNIKIVRLSNLTIKMFAQFGTHFFYLSDNLFSK